MQVTKIRVADENGLVPAGAYFARLAKGLAAENERTAAAMEKAEDRERKLEACYRRARAAAPALGSYAQLAAM